MVHRPLGLAALAALAAVGATLGAASPAGADAAAEDVAPVAAARDEADDAAAAAPPADPLPPEPSRARRALAVGAAVVPGVIVRGAGHWVAHDRRTARRLLWIEGAGLALAATGGLPLGISGGAGETLPGLVLLVPGAGLLIGSLAADIWGAAGGAAIAGTPAPPPALDVGLGWTYIVDPRVPFAHLATAEAELRHRRVRGAASGWLGDETWRARGAGGVRLVGPRPGERRADTTALDVEVAVAEERRAAQGLRIATAEASGLLRVDLQRVGPSLRGTFASFGLGLGAERVRYRATAAADTSSLFIGHLGWGLALGDGRARALEVELYYQHRRDTLAGGLTPPTGANGFIGHVGAVATAWRAGWGATLRAEVGSAYVLSLAARVRLPELGR